MRTEECWNCEGFKRIDKTTPDGDVVEETCTVCKGDGRRAVDTSDSGLSAAALYDGEEWD